MTKENSTLLKKLKQYSALIAPALGLTTIANSQIVYSDIDPDFEVTDDTPGDGGGNGVTLDMDNDGTVDFIVAVWSSLSAQINLAAGRPYSSNGAGIMGYKLGNYYYPSALDAGNAVSSGADFFGYLGSPSMWGTFVWYYLNGNGTLGQWGNVEDKYMGVMFANATGVHYGWVRMDISFSPTTKIVLKDLAYEDTPDASIDAGATGNVAVQTVNNTSDINIFSFERTVYISSPNSSQDNMNVKVIDVTGKTVLDINTHESSTRLNLSNLAGGLYVVSAEKAGQVKTQKISLR